MDWDIKESIIVIAITLSPAVWILYLELTQERHYWFRIILIPILFMLGIFFLVKYLVNSAPERAIWREERKEAHRLELEKQKQKEAEMSELLKQQKDAEYAIRQQLGTEIKKMPKYNNWKEKVFDECGRKCEICGETSDLEIHHKISFDKIIRIFNIQTKEQAFECDVLWDIANGSVLCHECHEKMESSIYRKKVTTGTF